MSLIVGDKVNLRLMKNSHLLAVIVLLAVSAFTVSTFTVSDSFGQATNLEFNLVGINNPTGITFGNDKFYAVESNLHFIYVYDTNGSQISGESIVLKTNNIHNNQATGIVYDSDNSKIYTIDNEDNHVYAYNPTAKAHLSSDSFDVVSTDYQGITYYNNHLYLLVY